MKSRIGAALEARKSAKKPLNTRPYIGSAQFGKTDPETGLRSVEIVGNSGTPFRYWGETVVVDFKRTTSPQVAPILRDHDMGRILGHTTKATKNLIASGVMSGDPGEVEQVLSMADRGYPWQSSIHLDINGYEVYDDDHEDPIKVNGQEYNAPLVVVWGHVREYTIVSLGADENTSSTFFSWNPEMADELDQDELDLEIEDTDELDLDADEDESDEDFEFDDETELDAEDASDAVIKASTSALRYVASIKAKGHKYGASEEDIAKALEKRLTPEQFEIACLRKSRGASKHRPAGDDMTNDNDVLEAALYQALNRGEAPKGAKVTQKAMDLAHKEYKGNIGLQELLLDAAKRGGYSGKMRYRGNERDVLRAAFSVHGLSGVLSNVQNTLIRNAFMQVEDVWRQVAKIGSVNDFKTHTRYYLTGDMTFEELGPTGEIKHGTMGEGSYAISIDTHAKMMAITRRDLINDDLGAFNEVGRRLGRGAALQVNKIFWPTFMNNSTFFTTARGNYMEGAGTTLDIASLNDALVLLAAYEDDDGEPYPVTVDRLLVPKSLEATAKQIYNDSVVAATGDTNALVHVSNPHRAQFQPLSSIYLSNSAYTGYSTTAWYLLGNPDDLHTVEIAFLNGKQEPTIETTDADFDQLGIQSRGYFDFGVAMGEYRAGFKSKGAA